MTNPEFLLRAITDLGAVEVAPKRYAFRLKSGWYTAHENHLHAIAHYGDVDAGDNWEAIRLGAKMPDWWTPEKQVAICRNGNDYEPMETSRSIRTNFPIVTADLETGREIAA